MALTFGLCGAESEDDLQLAEEGDGGGWGGVERRIIFFSEHRDESQSKRIGIYLFLMN